MTQSKNLLKAERVDYILHKLQAMYPNPPIPLDHKDEYTLLIAVLLSAQCTDERVNQVTPTLWQLADNPVDMSNTSIEAIREIIRPCGLSPQKSAAIFKLSHILIAEHNGEVIAQQEAATAPNA